jgi:hypothetical protein
MDPGDICLPFHCSSFVLLPAVVCLQPAAIKVPVQAHFGKLDTLQVRGCLVINSACMQASTAAVATVLCFHADLVNVSSRQPSPGLL